MLIVIVKLMFCDVGLLCVASQLAMQRYFT